VVGLPATPANHHQNIMILGGHLPSKPPLWTPSA
jgi:hypothetical protein